MEISFINNFLLIIFLVVLLMSFYVLKADFKNPLNISFGIFSFSASIWVFLNYLWGFYQTSNTILTLTYIISPIMIVTMYTWVNFLFRKNLPNWLGLTIIAATAVDLSVAIIAIISRTELISSVKNRFEFTTGPIFTSFAIYFFVLILGFLIYFFIEYKRSDPELKKSLNVITTGILITLIFASVVSFVLPSIGYVNLAIFDAPSIIFFVVFSAYAILKLELFNVKTVVTEISTYLVMVLSFILLFVIKEDVNIGIKVILMGLFIYGGYTLIKSVKTEVKQKEDLERLAQKLSLANKKLEEVDAMKTEFISMASHELLTPISAIKGYLSMILDEKLVKIEDENAVRYLDSIYKSSNRLAKLVADLLNVSRIEQARLLVAKEEINLEEVVTSVVDELKFKAKEKKHSLKICGVDKNAKSYGDVDKIKEVLVNFCGNAIKYTPDGGEISVCINRVETKKIEEEYSRMEKISVENAAVKDSSLQNAIDPKLRELVGDYQVVVCVTDNGAGLSDDDLSHLFKKFSRVGDFTTQKVQGTGLGLYISRALIEMQHGRAWAISDGRGKGSTFCFSLPELTNKTELDKLDSKVEIASDAKPLAKS